MQIAALGHGLKEDAQLGGVAGKIFEQLGGSGFAGRIGIRDGGTAQSDCGQKGQHRWLHRMDETRCGAAADLNEASRAGYATNFIST